MDDDEKQKGRKKTAPLPIRTALATPLPKPHWIRVSAASRSTRFDEVDALLRKQNLVTVCEEATCPNRGECFGKGTATFMILGDKCTRRCPFCDVAHGRPDAPDASEPERLAEAVALLKLSHVVITSVSRDDLSDGGAAHYAACIQQIRQRAPETRIEILTPDFQGRDEKAITILGDALPDVLNHNLETVPRLYRQARPGANYVYSLSFLKRFRARYPAIPTKSGLMVGLGESDEEILQVMQDLRDHDVDMLTIGQYLAPSAHHLPVVRYVHPDTFGMFEKAANRMGFLHAATGTFVRSSYHADEQANEARIRELQLLT
jgi:lipoic acid synthetase